MMEIESDKERTALAMAVARMWRDPEYKKQFVSDPKLALGREGVNFSEHTSVKVVEEAAKVKYVDIGKEEQAEEILRQLLPIPEGQEVRFVQSTGNLRYLILPAAPKWSAPGSQLTSNMLDASTKYTSVEAEIDVQSVVVQAISVSPIVEQSLEAVEVVVAETSEGMVMDSQAIEVAQVEVESSVAEVVAMT